MLREWIVDRSGIGFFRGSSSALDGGWMALRGTFQLSTFTIQFHNENT